jgi:AraC family ethanolamine operon transcriptional activator
VSVVLLTDPTAVKDGFEVVSHDVISLAEEPFLAERIVVHLAGIVLVFHQASHRLRTNARIETSRMAINVLGSEAKVTYDGVSMGLDGLVVAAPGAEVELVAESGYSGATLLISPEELRDHLAACDRKIEFRMPANFDFPQGTRSTARRFFSMAKRIALAAKRNPRIFTEDAATRSIAKQDILEALVAALTHNSAVELTQAGLKRQKYSQIIKMAVAYAEQNTDGPLYISDLCRVLKVSERTLQYAFQDVMKMTPMTYLKIWKLHRVRDDLRAATKGSTTVTVLALKWGFWHSRNFSQAYKKCFHERPSETLRA